ncbi:hypothetical protein DFH27DRAFT_638967 [Peziza echinospora]|nr:hypothetical protein DFH27DRAFT_638967 [Peziza echinospora]
MSKVAGLVFGAFPAMNFNLPLLRCHNDIQKNARLLHSILGEKLAYRGCQCGFVHTAHLQLQMRYAAPLCKPDLSANAAGERGSFRFSCMFFMEEHATDWTGGWQELQLESIDTWMDSGSARDARSPRTRESTQLAPPPPNQFPPETQACVSPLSSQGTVVTPGGATNSAAQLLRIPHTLYAIPHIYSLSHFHGLQRTMEKAPFDTESNPSPYKCRAVCNWRH